MQLNEYKTYAQPPPPPPPTNLVATMNQYVLLIPNSATEIAMLETARSTTDFLPNSLDAYVNGMTKIR